MKKVIFIFYILIFTITKGYCQYNFGNQTYSQPRTLYVSPPIDEYKEYYKVLNEKNMAETNVEINNAARIFLNYEKAAYGEINKANPTKEDIEGFLFYFTKADSSFMTYLNLVFHAGQLRNADDMLQNHCDLEYVAGYCYFSLNNFKDAKEVLARCSENYKSIKLLEKILAIEKEPNGKK